MEQIAYILKDRTDLDAIHLISHGDQGELQLGTGRLTLESMQGEYADELSLISQALSDDADFLIYGCNFGEGQVGQTAASKLAELTGADIAASDDTGITGRSAASASPCATQAAMRTPVNEPGPLPNATDSDVPDSSTPN